MTINRRYNCHATLVVYISPTDKWQENMLIQNTAVESVIQGNLLHLITTISILKITYSREYFSF